MTARFIEAKLSTSDRVFKTEYDFGDNLDEAVAKFGAEVVFTKFIQAATIDLQSLIRRHLTPSEVKAADGTVSMVTKTDAEIAALVAEWEPGNKTVVRRSPLEKAKEQLSKLSDEEKAALLAQLQAA